MAGEGRESRKDNDLFYTCSLIDYIARKTKNTRADVVDKLGKQRLDKIYDLADVYHCDNIDRVSADFIEEAGIQEGNFDNVKECNYAIPSHWDIGKVYKRLIKAVAEHEKIEVIDALIKVYNSFLSDKIDDYNSSMYYEKIAFKNKKIKLFPLQKSYRSRSRQFLQHQRYFLFRFLKTTRDPLPDHSHTATHNINMQRR